MASVSSLNKPPSIPLHMETRTMTEEQNKLQTATQNQAMFEYTNTAPIQFRPPAPDLPAPLLSVSTRDVKKGIPTVIEEAPSVEPFDYATTANYQTNAVNDGANIQYALVNDTDFVALNGNQKDLSRFSKILYTPKEPDSPGSPQEKHNKSRDSVPKCKKGEDIIFKFYMGSIAVVGLYVLYRIL